MIKVGTLAKIRRLYFRDKQPIKEICRQTGLSRNTVRTWLRESEMVEPKYPARPEFVNDIETPEFINLVCNWVVFGSGRSPFSAG